MMPSNSRSCRRRSSQYSLFPSCTSTPSENDTQSPTKPPLTRRRSSITSHSSRSSSRNSRKSGDLPLRELSNTPNESSNFTGKRKSKSPDKMVQLIPLKLDKSPVTKPVAELESPIFPARSSSLAAFLLPEEQLPPPPPPLRAAKRNRPGPVTELTILPYSRQDWEKVMEEVKLSYARGQYKHCSARCKQVLTNIKDPVRLYFQSTAFHY